MTDKQAIEILKQAKFLAKALAEYEWDTSYRLSKREKATLEGFGQVLEAGYSYPQLRQLAQKVSFTVNALISLTWFFNRQVEQTAQF